MKDQEKESRRGTQWGWRAAMSVDCMVLVSKQAVELTHVLWELEVTSVPQVGLAVVFKCVQKEGQLGEK